MRPLSNPGECDEDDEADDYEEEMMIVTSPAISFGNHYHLFSCVLRAIGTFFIDKSLNHFIFVSKVSKSFCENRMFAIFCDKQNHYKAN